MIVEMACDEIGKIRSLFHAPVFMKLSSLSILGALFLCATPVHANTVSRVTASVENPEPAKPFTVTFTFAEGQGPIGCGMQIDWGDGKVERLRFGDGQQVLPPYAVEHTYATPGQYKLRVTGEMIFRGVRSTPPCNVSREGILRVVDPVEVARAAEQRAAEERERRERAEADARARRERLDAEEQARRQREEAQKSTAQAQQRPSASPVDPAAAKAAQRISNLQIAKCRTVGSTVMVMGMTFNNKADERRGKTMMDVFDMLATAKFGSLDAARAFEKSNAEARNYSDSFMANMQRSKTFLDREWDSCQTALQKAM